MSDQTPMRRRALALAEELYDFNRRLLSSDIPGLAELLVTFAENEVRIARRRRDVDGGHVEEPGSDQATATTDEYR